MAIHPPTQEGGAALPENFYIGDLYVPDVFYIDAVATGAISMILMRHPAPADLNLSGSRSAQSFGAPPSPLTPRTEMTRAINASIPPTAPEEDEERWVSRERSQLSEVVGGTNSGVHWYIPRVIFANTVAAGLVRMTILDRPVDPALLDFSAPFPTEAAPETPETAGWREAWGEDAPGAVADEEGEREEGGAGEGEGGREDEGEEETNGSTDVPVR